MSHVTCPLLHASNVCNPYLRPASCTCTSSAASRQLPTLNADRPTHLHFANLWHPSPVGFAAAALLLPIRHTSTLHAPNVLLRSRCRYVHSTYLGSCSSLRQVLPRPTRRSITMAYPHFLLHINIRPCNCSICLLCNSPAIAHSQLDGQVVPVGWM